MKFTKSMQLAMSSIVANKMRSFLTMLGIIIGVAAVIILVSVMDGVTGQVTDIFESLGTNTISVTIIPRGSNRTVDADDLYDLMEENPDLYSHVSPRVTLSGNVKSRSSTEALTTTSVTGVSEQYFDMSSLNLSAGRFLQFIDVEKKLKVCIVGSYVAKNEFGKLDCTGETLKINGTPFTIVGVLEEKADSEESSTDDCVYIPYTVATKMSMSSVVTSYAVSARNDEVVDQATAMIKSKLADVLGSDDSFIVISMKEILEQMETITKTLEAALVCIAGISLLVGGIGIMNIMLVSVTERTREIGIRKSLGAKRKNIMQQFVIEAGTISGFGGIIGIIFGAVVAFFAGQLLNITVTPSAGAVAVAFGVSVTIGILFGFLPASKASKLNPIDALRSE